MSSFKYSACTYVNLFIKTAISLTLYSVVLIMLSLSTTDHLIRAAVGIPAHRWNNPRYRPGYAQRVPEGWVSETSRLSAHVGVKVVSRTHWPPLPPGNIPGTHFCWRLSRPQGHSAAGRIMSMKNSSDIIGNRTRDLPARSAEPGWNGTQFKCATSILQEIWMYLSHTV